MWSAIWTNACGTVGAFARDRHHDHRHTKQSDEERNFNRHVDHHGCWSRYLIHRVMSAICVIRPSS